MSGNLKDMEALLFYPLSGFQRVRGVRCGSNKWGSAMFKNSILLLSFLSLPVLAGTVSFQNDREGESYYSGKTFNKEIQKTLREVEGREIISVYQNTLRRFDDSNICAYTLNESMLKSFGSMRNGFREYEGVVYYLRSQNEIDDVVVKVLLDAYETSTMKLDLPKNSRRLRLPRDRQAVDDMVLTIGSFQKKFLLNTCFDEAYRSLYSDLRKKDKGLDSRNLEALLVEAFDRKLIDSQTYMALEQARENELESKWTTLKSYFQKKRSLRTNKPLRDPNEKSDFITNHFPKSALSNRMRLMEYYNDFQIMLMAEIVKKLRNRIEADKAEILIYRKEEIETIPLEPMERFRLAVKLLRKEMALIGQNHYFNGRSPGYMDIITASYEVGAIPATELAELSSLEELWNPKKSFWQKAQSWVRGAGSIATLLLPPPFGFIPSLGIVIIEMTTTKENNNGNDPTVLF